MRSGWASRRRDAQPPAVPPPEPAPAYVATWTVGRPAAATAAADHPIARIYVVVPGHPA